MDNLTNRSPMPFGKYEGWELRQVPAKQLIWYWENIYKEKCDEKSPPLCRYIHDNLEELKKMQFASKINFRY